MAVAENTQKVCILFHCVINVHLAISAICFQSFPILMYEFYFQISLLAPARKKPSAQNRSVGLKPAEIRIIDMRQIVLGITYPDAG